jgi:hypothetical protein
MMNFDTAHFFRTYGGPAGLLKEIDRWQPGLSLSYGQVAMWRVPGRGIPTKWMPTILYLLGKTGHSCSEFLIDDDELGLTPLPPPSKGKGKGINARLRG